MFTVRGKYSEAKVYASIVEDEAMSQIYNFVNSPVTENCNVAIMPDVHAGKGICTGYTQTIKDKVVPNAVSVEEPQESKKRPCTGEELVEMLKKQGVEFLKSKLSGIRYSIDYFDNIAIVIDGEMHTYQELCEYFSLLDGSELWMNNVPPECISPTPDEIGG